MAILCPKYHPDQEQQEGVSWSVCREHTPPRTGTSVPARYPKCNNERAEKTVSFEEGR